MKNKYSFTDAANKAQEIRFLTEQKADGSFIATIFHFSDFGKQISDEGKSPIIEFSSQMIEGKTEKEVIFKCEKMIIQKHPGNYEFKKID